MAALGDSESVARRAGLRSVDLGWRLVRVHRNQSSLDPPMPVSDGAGLTVVTVVVVGRWLVSAFVVSLGRRFRTHS